MAISNRENILRFISVKEVVLFLLVLYPSILVKSSEFVEDVDSEAIVETPIGRVQGLQKEFLRGKKVNVYLGIPYAEPPIGKQRFKVPRPVQPRNVINATEFSASCPSNDPFTPAASYGEDCLYLNIWSPVSHEHELKPVMLWIHGGGFIFGSTNFKFYEGLTLAASEDVVVVSINYRLGALGFLSLGQDGEVRGNMGLMDQAEAIKWVKNYIHLFGGDPEQITLFGESAGGFSVAYHLVSPVTNNLFKRGIIQSGAGHGNVLAEFNAATYVRNSNRFIDMIGCSSQLAEEELRCLQEANMSAIMNTQDKCLMDQLIGFFGPTIDGHFLPNSSEKLLQDGQIGQGIQEIMVGVTSDEGSLFMPILAQEKFSLVTDIPVFTEEEAKDIMYTLFNGTLNPSEIEVLFKFYSEKYGEGLLYKAIYESYGDFVIACPAIYTSEELSNHEKKIYFYEFAHRSNASLLSLSFDGEWLGVRHFEEVPFVFGFPVKSTNYSAAEIELSRRVMNTWATFAKTGKPPTHSEREWPLFKKETPRYLRIKLQESEEGVGFHAENCEKWRSYITKVSTGDSSSEEVE